jgi:hypothetical protein
MKFLTRLESNGRSDADVVVAMAAFQWHLGKLATGLFGNAMAQKSVAVKQSQSPIALQGAPW